MKILRVFNNNVVLAKDGAREVIVTGRGLGFQAKPGQRVDDAKIVRVFVPADGRDPDHIAELLSEIPPEIIRLVTDAMTATGLAEQAESQPTLVMALADHITGAVQRAQRHVNIAYPLQAEVQSLYASEYAQASRLVNELNRHLNGVLPGSEGLAVRQQARALVGGDERSHGCTSTDLQSSRGAFTPSNESTNAQPHVSAET